MKSRALEIKNFINELKQDYSKISDTSYAEYVKNLPIGSPTPKRGVIFGDTYKKAFSERAEAYKQKTIGLIDDEINDLRKKTTATPTEDDVRTLQLLNMRTSLSNEEIESYADRFSSSEVCYRTLKDIAAKSGKHIPDNLIETQISNLCDLRKSMNNTFDSIGRCDSDLTVLDFIMAMSDNDFTE